MSVKKEITLLVNKKELNFSMSDMEYKNFLNDIEVKNKCLPAIRLLKSCVKQESKELLNKYIDTHFLEMANTLIKEFQEDVEIEVKK